MTATAELHSPFLASSAQGGLDAHETDSLDQKPVREDLSDGLHHLRPSLTCLVVTLQTLSAGVRGVQVHELVTQGSMAALLLLSGNWFTGACHAGLLAYMLHLYSTRRIYVDTTDAFRQLPQQKVQRGILLGAHLALFVVVVYRLIESALMTLLTPEGRAMTKKLLHEAEGVGPWVLKAR